MRGVGAEKPLGVRRKPGRHDSEIAPDRSAELAAFRAPLQQRPPRGLAFAMRPSRPAFPFVSPRVRRLDASTVGFYGLLCASSSEGIKF